MDEMSYALVTGASYGIGRAIAEELASSKHNLILHSLTDQGLSAICDVLMNKYKIHVIYSEVDLTITEVPQSLYEFSRNKSCKVDILVNNAGIGFDGPIENYSVNEIDSMIFLNIRL
jgi:short-subunit dehydrogenase